MAKLQINTGVIELDIERDGKKVGKFSFNPTNLSESRKHAEIVDKLEKEQTAQLAKAKELDENGTSFERIDFMKEFVTDMRNKIDEVYGEGTSEMCFGDCYSAEVITDFFVQLKPYYKKASAERKAKYYSNN